MVRGGENLSNMRASGAVTWPATESRLQTWDYISPDIVTPYASSTVGDVIALAHRLGMAWSEKDLRPGDGVMRAEGNGQSISSTVIRGFGLLLQYTYDEASHGRTTWNDDGEEIQPTPLADLTIPTEEADKLGFQIIPGVHSLGLPDFEFDYHHNPSHVLRAMESLGIGRVAREHYRNYMKPHSRYCGFSDLLSIVAPFMPLWHSSIVRVLAPHPDVHDTPMRQAEGHAIFHARLCEIPRSPQMQKVLRKYEEMANHQNETKRSRWNNNPSSGAKDGGGNEYVHFLDEVHDKWEWTSLYFEGLMKTYRAPHRKFRYRDLVAAHISQAIYYPTIYEERRKNKESRIQGSPGEWDFYPRLNEGMHLYIDRIEEVVRFMRDKGFGDFEGDGGVEELAQVVRDAWWMMMFRAICWNYGVDWVVGPRPGQIFGVPPNLYGSRIPVFIA